MAIVMKAENTKQSYTLRDRLIGAEWGSNPITAPGTRGQEVVLGVSVDPDGSRPHGVRQDVHHRERSAHEAEAEARD